MLYQAVSCDHSSKWLQFFLSMQTSPVSLEHILSEILKTM